VPRRKCYEDIRKTFKYPHTNQITSTKPLQCNSSREEEKNMFHWLLLNMYTIVRHKRWHPCIQSKAHCRTDRISANKMGIRSRASKQRNPHFCTLLPIYRFYCGPRSEKVTENTRDCIRMHRSTPIPNAHSGSSVATGQQPNLRRCKWADNSMDGMAQIQESQNRLIAKHAVWPRGSATRPRRPRVARHMSDELTTIITDFWLKCDFSDFERRQLPRV